MKNLVVALAVAFLSVSMNVTAQEKAKEPVKKECCSKDKKSCSKDDKACHTDKKASATTKKECASKKECSKKA